jgi:hypothetical protein
LEFNQNLSHTTGANIIQGDGMLIFDGSNNIPQTETSIPHFNHPSNYVVPNSLSLLPTGTTTTMMSYLTSANPAPSLVRKLNLYVRDSNAKHFWWDIRQIRP